VGHPLARKRSPARVEDLRGADLLLLEDGHCLRDQALEVCASAQVHELGFRATSLGTLVQMVASGAGVTLLPTLALPTESRRAELAVRPFTKPAPRRTLALAWRKQAAAEPALRAVAAVAREACARAQAREERAVATR
jgi:LysR family hydrogen peroxide-inducible transcriptional activator